MGDLIIVLILAGMFAFAWYIPEFSDQDLRFIDERVFWGAVAVGVVVSAIWWSVNAMRSRLHRSRR